MDSRINLIIKRSQLENKHGIGSQLFYTLRGREAAIK